MMIASVTHRTLCWTLAAMCLLTAGCSVLGSEPSEDSGGPSGEVVEENDGDPTGADSGVDDRGRAPLVESAISLFDRVAGGVVFIQNGDFFGSGVHIGGGQILTNAHVVYPSVSVRLVLADGREVLDVPVTAVDHVYDLALVGPIEADLPEIEISTEAPPPVGSQLYAIGFPGEVESRPSPTMTSGILSRIRSAPEFGIDFLQIDMRIAGGQSGGGLFDPSGELVALTGLAEFTEANFGLALSAADVIDGLDRLRTGLDDPATRAELPEAMVARAAAGQEQRLRLPSQETGAFLVESTVDEVLDLRFEVESDADVWIEVQTLAGDPPKPTDDSFRLARDHAFASVSPYDFDAADGADGSSFADETLAGVERIDRRLQGPGSWWVLVGQLGSEPAKIGVSANVALIPLVDDDEGDLGEGMIEGVSDFPGDVDRFTLSLNAGEAVQISADALGDTVLAVVDPDGSPVAFNDDTAGLYGLGSSIEFEAPTSGVYTVELEQHQAQPAGYVIRVETAGASN